MKKTVYPWLLLGLLLTHAVTAQVTSKFVWTVSLPSQPLAVAADGPRGAYVLLKGNTLVQFDAQGRQRWQQTFTDWPAIQRIATTPAGELVLAGTFTGQFTLGDSTYRLAEDYHTSTFVVELNINHAKKWATYVISPDGLMRSPTSLATDASGAVLALGSKTDGGNPFLARFDSDGRFTGSQVYGGATVPPPNAVAMAANSQGMALVSIAERTRTSSSGVLALVTDDSLYWRTYMGESLSNTADRRFDTQPLSLATDRRDNTVVLANYTQIDQTLGRLVETGQALLRYDANGKNTWLKTGVTRTDSAVATGLVADPAGAFVVFGGYEGEYTPETNQYSSADYISLASYSPEGALRWTTRLNATNGNDRLLNVARADNGSLLLLGSTTGTLPALSLTGSAASPAYFLTNLQPFELQPVADARPVVLCAGGQTTLRGQYAGHFEQPLTLQLSDDKGVFGSGTLQSQTLATVSIGVPGSLFTANDFAVSIPVASTLAPGTGYQLRAVSALPEYIGAALSVSVAQAPGSPTVEQAGAELVASSTATSGITFQWYTAGNQPVAGATSARFRPSQPGTYYAVAVTNGCASLASEALSFILLAAEPTAEVSVYPNPVSDRLLVQWPAAIGTNGRLDLTDLNGRSVRQQARTGEVTEVSVRELPTGLYLLNLQADGQPRLVRKVMVR
jgi:Secretion system C-terminal sorting domain